MAANKMSSDEEYKFLNAKAQEGWASRILFIVMFLVTVSCLLLDYGFIHNHYLDLLPFVVILPSYVLYHNHRQCVIKAETYQEVFYKSQEQALYHYETRLELFEKERRKLSPAPRFRLRTKLRRFGYLCCSLICIFLYFISAFEPSDTDTGFYLIYNAQISLLELIVGSVVSLLTILIFIIFREPSRKKYLAVWESVERKESSFSSKQFINIELVRANMSSILNMVLDVGSIFVLVIYLVQIYHQSDLKISVAIEGLILLLIILIGLTFQNQFEDHHCIDELGYFAIKLDSFLEAEGVSRFYEKYSGNMVYLYYFLIPVGLILPVFDFWPALLITIVVVFLYILSVHFSRKNSRKSSDVESRDKNESELTQDMNQSAIEFEPNNPNEDNYGKDGGSGLDSNLSKPINSGDSPHSTDSTTNIHSDSHGVVDSSELSMNEDHFCDDKDDREEANDEES